ncbi:sterol desaturase family protein [Leptolyngbya cf. ectocarpi LEGE 11479]|uniref:Sterol desaturase family protein n=1 Tax=Leptolyngbya cf. ectocarpi LEGE 11479 TaxID=1828722 RepID=A0A928ZWH6_LEPEC|nr:sterol desaturase family protein [Leptolyngbya ectocarpi]MBE9068731.1 sterol desaturase family protein [Leptolyngbya cf. ectocarpi LEGE 11479]
MIIFGTFVLLITLTAIHSWGELRQKKRTDWILDTAGLWVQGLLIPLLQLTLLQTLYQQLIPAWQHSVQLHPVFAFALSFVAVDYLYYWNHRFLHSRWGWFAHQVHHTVSTMDVLGTSRNTLWSSFLIVYLWVHGLLIYLLADPSVYVLGVSLTAALDLWRHGRFGPQPRSQLYQWLSGWLILPQDHGWHHQGTACNYGANLKLWDRLHGTLHLSAQWPTTLGQPSHLPLWRQLLYPH